MLVDLSRMRSALGAVLLGGSGGAAFSGAMVYRAGNLNVNDGVSLVVPWNTEEYDFGDWFDSSGDTFFTVPVGVTRVRLYGGTGWPVAAGDYRHVRFQKNGSDFRGSGEQYTAPTAVGFVDKASLASAPIVCVPGDVFRMRVEQKSGASLLLQASSATYFGIEAVR